MTKCKDKICPNGKFCNPETGRCKNIPKPVRRSKKVASKKTSKKVASKKSYRKASKKTSRKASKKSYRKASKKTSRKVSKKSSRKVASKKVTSDNKKVSELFDDFPNRLVKNIKSDYVVKRIIGMGIEGVVVEVVNKQDKKLALKIVRLNDNYKVENMDREFYLMNEFSKIEVSPKVYSKKYIEMPYTKDVYGMFEMDLVEGTLEDLLLNEDLVLNGKLDNKVLDKAINDTFNLISKVHKAGYIHGDVHPGNIGYVVTRNGLNFYLLDSGWSCCQHTIVNIKKIYLLDYLQFIRSILRRSEISKYNKTNILYLQKAIIDIIRPFLEEEIEYFRNNDIEKMSNKKLLSNIENFYDRYQKYYSTNIYRKDIK
jgi:tRNA A-37 threonylcarbamoyl transferase component Bud32